MLSEVLVLDHSVEQKDFKLPEQLSSNTTTHVTKFNSVISLLEYLLVSIKFKLILANNNELERVINEDEVEINYPFIILINTNNFNKENGRGNGHKPIDMNSLIKLLKIRFYHLNLLVYRFDFEDKVDRDLQFDSKIGKDLKIINGLINDRLIRIETWIGLNDEKINQYFNTDSYSTINSMTAFINNVENNEENYELIIDLISTIEFRTLLDIKKSDDYYLQSLNQWNFQAYEFSIDELLYISYLILSNAKFEYKFLSNDLYSFLFFIRDNYRLGNPFHNFRHAVDVLQATNFFLLKSDDGKNSIDNEENNYKIYSLLLASLGHDIGHPGITNNFLITFKTQIAKKFNNESILENFHYFQFRKILEPFFKKSILENLSSSQLNYFNAIIFNSILATDMARHDLFVGKIDEVNKANGDFILLASLLLKCADISNVCRPLNSSCKWGLSLGEEFKEVALLEKLLNNESKELNLKKLDFMIKNININEAVNLVNSLSNSQMFFINRFAKEFFQKISDSLPELDFLINQLNENTIFWVADIEKRRKD